MKISDGILAVAVFPAIVSWTFVDVEVGWINRTSHKYEGEFIKRTITHNNAEEGNNFIKKVLTTKTVAARHELIVEQIKKYPDNEY